MARVLAAIAVATAFHLLALLHGASAARPMGRQQAAAFRTGTLALAPAGDQNQQLRTAAAAAAEAGKWLPFAGVHHHLPAPAYWAHRPAPWVGAGGLGGAGAVEGEGAEGEVLVRERERRQRPTYESEGTITRQEQLAMWASLLNPEGKGRTATGWLPAPGAGEVAYEEPVKAADAVEGAEADDPAADGARAGQTYWGNNGN